MNLNEYRVVFAVGSLILILLATVPTLNLVLSSPSGAEQFSEFWVLGPNHVMADYPSNVEVNQTNRVFVGVRNHMDSTVHYMVYVKFRNQTQPLPDALNSMPSSLPPLYEYHAYVADEGTWEAPLDFSVLRASRVGNSTLVSDISINDVVFSVNSYATESSGFSYEIFFELWIYNTTSMSFQYHNRFVGFGLSMAGDST
jgi:hypothetical protein